MRLVKAGETIIKEGDPGDEMYVVDRYYFPTLTSDPPSPLPTTPLLSSIVVSHSLIVSNSGDLLPPPNISPFLTCSVLS